VRRYKSLTTLKGVFLTSISAVAYDFGMRTTITIDPDVEHLLRDAMQRHGLTLDEAINQAVRQGAAEISVTPAPSPFVVKPRTMKARVTLEPGTLQQVGDEIEIDAFLELTRRRQQAMEQSP
jgi:hypothetical protein